MTNKIVSKLVELAKKYGDLNDDGKIDVQDLKLLGLMTKQYIDKDKNGIISKEEWKGFLKKLRILGLDALIVFISSMVICYFANLNTFWVKLFAGDPAVMNQFFNIALFLATVLGIKEKYGAEIKGLVTKQQSKDDIIKTKDAEIQRLNGIISNSTFATEKKVLETQIADLREQLDALKTNVANTEALVEAKPK